MVKLIEEKLLMLSNLKVYRDNLKYFKYYKYILLTIFLVFFISANKAWLNPEPNNGAIKINKRIPILWQYIGKPSKFS
jgi:hypothetical protein